MERPVAVGSDFSCCPLTFGSVILHAVLLTCPVVPPGLDACDIQAFVPRRLIAVPAG